MLILINNRRSPLSGFDTMREDDDDFDDVARYTLLDLK